MLRQEWKEERCYDCTSTHQKRRYLPEIHGPKQWQLVCPLGLWSSSTAGPRLSAGFPSAHQLDRAHYLEGWDCNWQWGIYPRLITQLQQCSAVPKILSILLWNSCCPLFSGVHWTSLENSPKYETLDWEDKIKAMLEEQFLFWKVVCWKWWATVETRERRGVLGRSRLVFLSLSYLLGC